jgi:hypothetical protein
MEAAEQRFAIYIFNIYYYLIIYLYYYSLVEEKKELVLAQVDTSSDDEDLVVPAEQKPEWVELEMSNYQGAVSFLHSPSSSHSSSDDKVDDHSSTSSPDGVVVEQILPPPPPTSPPLSQQQISDLQALDDLQFKTTTVEELHKIMNAGKKQEQVFEEVKESVNDDSLLSSVHYASSSSSAGEEDEGSSSSSSSDNSHFYHAVDIQGRGAVSVYRSKRAPKFKLYYFTASGKKAYLKQKHIGQIKRVEYHMLKSTDPIAFLNNPANGCLHGRYVCWCQNLNYYLNELYDV